MDSTVTHFRGCLTNWYFGKCTWTALKGLATCTCVGFALGTPWEQLGVGELAGHIEIALDDSVAQRDEQLSHLHSEHNWDDVLVLGFFIIGLISVDSKP